MYICKPFLNHLLKIFSIYYIKKISFKNCNSSAAFGSGRGEIKYYYRFGWVLKKSQINSVALISFDVFPINVSGKY